MRLSAKEAKELMPKGYITSDQLCVKIKAASEAGIEYIYTDLTLGQIDEFQQLGFKVEKSNYDRRYKISWQ